MSAWYIFSAMGFYPVTPGLDYYAIGTPLFDKVTLNLENGNTFEIISKNNGKDNIYIQSASLNDKSYTKSYLKHQDIMNGGKIVFEMGKEPNKSWGAKKEDRPYSPKYKCAPVPILKSTGRKFLESTKVILSAENKSAVIRYTLEGTEPDLNSDIYSDPILINKSSVVKAKCFVEGLLPGYTASFPFEKLKLQPAHKIANLKHGLNFIYKEGGFTKTADRDKYPIKNSGIIATINIDSINDDRPFAYTFEGCLKVPTDGLYVFYLESNDGFTLFLDNNLIIDNDGDHMLQTLFAEKALKKGYHAIKINYFQMGGGKKLEVKWKNSIAEPEEIPAAVLFHKM